MNRNRKLTTREALQEGLIGIEAMKKLFGRSYDKTLKHMSHPNFPKVKNRYGGRLLYNKDEVMEFKRKFVDKELETKYNVERIYMSEETKSILRLTRKLYSIINEKRTALLSN